MSTSPKIIANADRVVEVTVKNTKTGEIYLQKKSKICIVGIVAEDVPDNENTLPVDLFWLGHALEVTNLLNVIGNSITGFVKKALDQEIRMQKAIMEKIGKRTN